MIVDAPQMISVWHRSERAVEWQDLQSMTRQVEFTNDLGTQQRHDVRTNREFEARKNFFRHSRAAKHVSSLQHQHTLARPREIRGINQAVVAAADYDDIVFVIHSLPEG